MNNRRNYVDYVCRNICKHFFRKKLVQGQFSTMHTKLEIFAQTTYIYIYISPVRVSSHKAKQKHVLNINIESIDEKNKSCQNFNILTHITTIIHVFITHLPSLFVDFFSKYWR